MSYFMVLDLSKLGLFLIKIGVSLSAQTEVLMRLCTGISGAGFRSPSDTLLKAITLRNQAREAARCCCSRSTGCV